MGMKYLAQCRAPGEIRTRDLDQESDALPTELSVLPKVVSEKDMT